MIRPDGTMSGTNPLVKEDAAVTTTQRPPLLQLTRKL
jgi:hypothetical protein